ncbi:MAG: transcription antitermination factor NusB [Tissierellia bacterium]|nr:transcription antitermination factor NusB [Tissierellia bacterium]
MGRKYARESAMKLLYQMEINSDFTENATEIFFNNFTFDYGEIMYIENAAGTIIENLNIIDKYIEDNIERWEIHRLAKVDLSILRIAIYEMLYRTDIPVQVSINEAIEISKKYSNEESPKFINGILGGFVRSGVLEEYGDKTTKG